MIFMRNILLIAMISSSTRGFNFHLLMSTRFSLSQAMKMSTSPTSADQASPKKWALIYQYTHDMLAKRMPYRDQHLTLARKYAANGTLVAGGALGMAERGLLIFQGTKEDVQTFVKEDIYVTEKLVTQYEIFEWTVVVGNLFPTK